MRKHNTSRNWKSGSSHRRQHSSKGAAVLQLLFSKGFIGNALLLLGILAAVGVIFVGLVFLFVGRNLPDPNALQDRSVAQSTKIYDRTGENLLYEIHGDQKRTLVPFEEIPQDVIDAFISLEDDKFYDHHGIDVRGIIRAVLSNVVSGGKGQGASTLTQQLVKNAILSPEKTYTRKLKEVILSIKIENRYTKDQILQLYFNEIPFGSTNYGIESAALSYFGKEAQELTLAESATLAAMVKAPTRYINNPDLLLSRRDFVLDGMLADGYISEDELNAAKLEDTTLQHNTGDIVAPHFVFYVKELLEEEYGQRAVEEGGLSVVTTIDYDLQVAAQEEVATAVEERGPGLGFTNAALVAIEPSTGHVISMVGSHDYFDEESDGAVNVAIRPRQPGSSMKPLTYTALFEKGYTPNTVFYDVETDFPSDVGTYHPRNYDLKERGPVTVRKALQGSLNIPAVKALYMVGVQSFLDFAERMGYSTFEDRSRFGLSLVLGGGEVTLLEHTNAYATFANDGVRHDSVAILKVEDAAGEVLFEWEEQDGERVLDANVAAMTSNVLSDDAARQYAFGAGSYLQLGGRPVAAKTGTTNDYRDAWTMGYTPSIAVGVWGGNNDNSEMARGAGGSSVASPIWNAVMRSYLSGKPVESFRSPNIPELGKAALDGTLGSGETFTVDRITGKLATDETPARLREERTYVTHHSILYYVDRNNPTGPAPKDNSTDPQYPKWEGAVQDWVARQSEELGAEFVSEEPPTEYDDVHVARNIPDVSILSPDSGDQLESRSVTIQARVNAKRQIDRVEFYIDGFYLGQSRNSPYRLNTTIPPFVQSGNRTIRVVAFDDVENEGQATVSVNVPEAEGGVTIRILDPRPGQIIVGDGSYPVRVELGDPDRYSRIDFYTETRGGSGQQLVGSINNPASAAETFSWNLPDPGEYIFSAVGIDDQANDLVSGGNVLVTVEAPAPPPEEGEESGLVDEIVDELL